MRLKSKVTQFWQMGLHDQLNALGRAYYKMKGRLYYRHVFGAFGKNSYIYPPALIGFPKQIFIGDNVSIRPGARLEAVTLDEANPAEIHIGHNVNIEQNVHIVAIGKIYVRDNVSITANCGILGGTHPFFDVSDPQKIGNRLDGADSVTEIGEGSFLGLNSVIQMNVRLGRGVVVGSGSVVKRSVPDYTVVGGNPAVVVMSYDAERERWAAPKKNKE